MSWAALRRIDLGHAIRVALCGVTLYSSGCTSRGDASSALPSARARTSYAVGHSVGSRFRDISEQLDLDQLEQGLRDGLTAEAKREPVLSRPELVSQLRR